MIGAVYQLGNTTVTIYTDKILEPGTEAYEAANEKVIEAAWAIIDELLELGEEI